MALAHMYALPAASAVALSPLPQALDAGGGVAGHQGGVCKTSADRGSKYE